ncbi:ankyrin repeat domain-containing protein [Legionella gresilensis]|uniref:ankyrin repeat domain-containing protein n=1 Tax=Legionella gresilensis TaxID=91823 RepID=UPI001040FFAE|nr:ankyrin repeat domain-containing protein [Legionella gresilensis]
MKARQIEVLDRLPCTGSIQNIRDKMISKIKSPEEEPPITPAEYSKFVQFLFKERELEQIPMALSKGFVQAISNQDNYFYVDPDDMASFEQKFYEVHFVTLLSLILETQEEEEIKLQKMELLFKYTADKPINLDRKPFIAEMKVCLPGASLIQLALRNNQLKIAQMLLDQGAKLDTCDYYGNTSHHYGAMGSLDAYQFVKNNLGDSNQKNIFNHQPLDYFSPPPNIKQSTLIDQLEKYSYLKNYIHNIIFEAQETRPAVKGEDIIKNVTNGFCQGDSFLRSIMILKGKESSALHTEMLESITRWNGDNEQLGLPFNTGHPLANHFKNLDEVFEYIFGSILFLHRNSQRVVNINEFNLVEQFQFITNTDDILTRKITETPCRDCQALKEQIRLAQKNSLFVLSLSNLNDFSEGVVVQEGHAASFSHRVTIIVDDKNRLHFVDPNCPYDFPSLPNNLESLNLIFKIMENYFGKINTYSSYAYTPASLSKREKIAESDTLKNCGNSTSTSSQQISSDRNKFFSKSTVDILDLNSVKENNDKPKL